MVGEGPMVMIPRDTDTFYSSLLTNQTRATEKVVVPRVQAVSSCIVLAVQCYPTRAKITPYRNLCDRVARRSITSWPLLSYTWKTCLSCDHSGLRAFVKLPLCGCDWEGKSTGKALATCHVATLTAKRLSFFQAPPVRAKTKKQPTIT